LDTVEISLDVADFTLIREFELPLASRTISPLGGSGVSLA
jgi:hypothetical protein